MLNRTYLLTYRSVATVVRYRLLFAIVAILMLLILNSSIPVFADGGTAGGVCSGC